MKMSLKAKLLLLSLPPTCVIFAIVILVSVTMTKHDTSLSKILVQNELSQREANATLISILNHQKHLYALIASEERVDIRQNAIAAIRAGSLLDEQIQKLTQALPDNPQVKILSEQVKKIRPKQMKVISYAKKNNDREAMLVLNEIGAKSDKVLEAAQTILNQEFQKIVGVSEINQKEIKQTFAIGGTWILVGLSIAVFITLLLNRSMLSSITNIQLSINKFAHGDLSAETHIKTGDEVAKMAESLNNAIGETRSIVTEIHTQSEILSANSTFISERAQESSNRTSNVIACVSCINESAEYILNIATDVNDQLSQCRVQAGSTAVGCQSAKNIINESINIQEQFGEDVKALEEQIQLLSDAATSITEISTTISTVSDQTNLLALNAAIEAARAGEHGRGFAVVANEVRSLANSSGVAVNEISELATTMRNSVAAVVEKLEHVQERFAINQGLFTNCSKEVNQASELSTALGETIVSVIEGVNNQQIKVGFIHERVEELHKMTAAASANVMGLKHLSKNLSDSSQILKTAISHFKS